MQFSGMNKQEESKYFEMLDKKNKNRKKSARCIFTGCEKHSIDSPGQEMLYAFFSTGP